MITFGANITDDTPVVQLTVGQLKKALQLQQSEEPKPVTLDEACGRYVYGLSGIAKLFGVSNVTAFRFKNGILKDAVYQQGRTIVCDVKKALELFAKR